MRDRLKKLLDRPAIIRTMPDDPSWKPITGIVFEVRDDAVDVMTSSSTMKTVAINRIVDVSRIGSRSRRPRLYSRIEHRMHARS